MQRLPNHVIRILTTLDEGQLRELHTLIISRLNAFSKAKALQALRMFNLLDKVRFSYQGETKKGMITRINQKTVTVVFENGEKWNISPHLLIKVI